MSWLQLALLPCAHAQGIKQSVYPSVVIGTKIATSLVLGICACCKRNESVEKLVSTSFKLLKYFTSAAFSVQHACGLSTTPTLLVCADGTAHTRVQCIQYYARVATERTGYML